MDKINQIKQINQKQYVWKQAFPIKNGLLCTHAGLPTKQTRKFSLRN